MLYIKWKERKQETRKQEHGKQKRDMTVKKVLSFLKQQRKYLKICSRCCLTKD